MNANGLILIVDDEPDLRTLLDLNLRREGFETIVVGTGGDALASVAARVPDLVILDLMLPDISGTEVCRRMRAMPGLASTAIIMLTARGEEIDRVVGFEVGADDYVVKSTFSMREMVLRVRAVLRRRTTAPEEPSAPDELIYGPLRVDLGGHRVYVSGEEIVLTATEFKLLCALAERPGRVLSRGALLTDVWELPSDLNTRTVDTHVKRLREKLGAGAVYLETVRGVGYRFAEAANE